MASPPTRPLLRERYDKRREDVVEVAARVFAEHGYHATTMQDLARATGLAAGGLYHYVAGKDDLLVAICDELIEPLLVEAEAVVAARRDPAETLRILVRLWVGRVADHRYHMIVFAQERHTLQRGSQWREVRRSRKRFEELMADALAAVEGRLPAGSGDQRLTLLALLGMVNHLPQWYRPRGRLTPEQIADGFCDLLVGAGSSAGS